MITVFQLITEEFLENTAAIRSLIVTLSDINRNPVKVRIAAANSATLLVSATFEEFIREMAREYAKTVVSRVCSVEDLPPKMVSVAWKRTMDGLSKIKFDGDMLKNNISNVFGVAQARFSVIHDFCRGDLSQDIYRDLIHNENNMRPNELNGLFKVSGLGDVCAKLSDKAPILQFFGEIEAGKTHGKLILHLEDFFERRNTIAHALNIGQSSSPDRIVTDLDMLESFAASLRETLDNLSPGPTD